MRIILPLVILLAASPLASAAEKQPPNILFILIDDMGWRDAGCYGSTFYETPNIDRLAKRGMRFTDAYAACPLCSPTRASILTGQYPGRLWFTMPAGHLKQVVLNPVIPAVAQPSRKARTPQTRTRLPNEYFTIAEALKEASYTTGFFGKWHLGREPYLPDNQGFDRVVGGREHPCPPGPAHYFGPWKNVATLPVVPEGTHICDMLTDEAIGFLKENKDNRFFLCLWYYDVHAPYQAIEELKKKYAAKADRDNPQHCPTMGGMVDILDQNIGRVMKSLDELGLSDDTLVVFTSDNGGNMYDRVDGTTPTNNTPLRNGKGNNYEGGVRVPLICVWPGEIEPGTVNETVVSSVDYYPTLLEATGLEPKSGQILDGASILPVLTGEGELDREAIFSHYPHYVPATENLPSTSVRCGDLKLYRFHCDNEDQTDRFELYNLADDIGETKNLAEARPDDVKRLNGLISRFLEETGALVPLPNPRYGQTVDGWEGNQDASLRKEDGTLVMKSTGGDPFITTHAMRPVMGPVKVTIRMKSDAKGTGRIFWSLKGKRGFVRRRGLNFPVTHDGAWHDYKIDLPFKGKMIGMRLDPCTSPGEVRIDSIRVEDGSDSRDAGMVWEFGGGKK